MSILGDEQTGLALISGAIVGLSLGLTGAGGSLLAIPLLVYVLKLSLHEATAISLVLVSAALSLVGYFRTGDVRVRTALVFSPTGLGRSASNWSDLKSSCSCSACLCW